jgi:hypothetical protein
MRFRTTVLDLFHLNEPLHELRHDVSLLGCAIGAPKGPRTAEGAWADPTAANAASSKNTCSVLFIVRSWWLHRLSYISGHAFKN